MKNRVSAVAKVRSLLESKSPLFDTRSLSALWGLSRESAKVEVFRLIQGGLLRQVRRGLYSLTSREPNDFEIANALYQPSVISLETALNYWGVWAQSPQRITSLADKSRRFVVGNTEFVYRRVPKKLLEVGAVEEKGFFMAEPLKAFLDYLYLGLKGIYTVDMDSFFLTPKIKWEEAAKYLMFYPSVYQGRIRKLSDQILKKGYRGVR